MKTNLLWTLLPLTMASVQLSAQEYCEPENEWQPYAGISQVEINGMLNVSGRTPKGGTCDFGEYYMGEPDKMVKLEANGTYTLKVEFDNFNSGSADKYYVRAYFDWNCDGEFSKSETYKKEIVAGPTGKTVPVELEIEVPADAITGRLSRMRVFTSYISTDPSYSSTDPCALVEGGNFEDYDLKMATASGLSTASEENFRVGPNPGSDILYIQSEEKVLEFGLYTMDGRLADAGQLNQNFINVSGYQAGTYLLKVMTEATVKQSVIIIK